jgi:hypothetical protein
VQVFIGCAEFTLRSANIDALLTPSFQPTFLNTTNKKEAVTEPVIH